MKIGQTTSNVEEAGYESNVGGGNDRISQTGQLAISNTKTNKGKNTFTAVMRRESIVSALSSLQIT